MQMALSVAPWVLRIAVAASVLGVLKSCVAIGDAAGRLDVRVKSADVAVLLRFGQHVDEQTLELAIILD